jgi:DNA-binding transcriptional MerR regulator
MPRGVRMNKPVEEKLKDIDAKIEQLQKQKAAIIQDMDKINNQAAISQLLEAAKNAGKTPAELVAELAK